MEALTLIKPQQQNTSNLHKFCDYIVFVFRLLETVCFTNCLYLEALELN